MKGRIIATLVGFTIAFIIAAILLGASYAKKNEELNYSLAVCRVTGYYNYTYALLNQCLDEDCEDRADIVIFNVYLTLDVFDVDNRNNMLFSGVSLQNYAELESSAADPILQNEGKSIIKEMVEQTKTAFPVGLTAPCYFNKNNAINDIRYSVNDISNDSENLFIASMVFFGIAGALLILILIFVFFGCFRNRNEEYV